MFCALDYGVKLVILALCIYFGRHCSREIRKYEGVKLISRIKRLYPKSGLSATAELFSPVMLLVLLAPSLFISLDEYSLEQRQFAHHLNQVGLGLVLYAYAWNPTVQKVHAIRAVGYLRRVLYTQRFEKRGVAQMQL